MALYYVSWFGFHPAQAAHNQITRGIHGVVIAFNDLAVLVTGVEPEFLQPVPFAELVGQNLCNAQNPSRRSMSVMA
jgi:hypothetical protein